MSASTYEAPQELEKAFSEGRKEHFSEKIPINH